MDLIVVLSLIALFFLLIGLAEPLADRLRLPAAVIFALVGIVVGAGAGFLLRTDLTDAFNPVAAAILSFPIRSSVFLNIFLPTLVFQVTLGLNLRRMADDWVPVLVLAVVAVLAATAIIGAGLYLTGMVPLMVALLIGAIVSTTDPSAVVSIFGSLSAPRRLSRIIEGESLLNDAAAIALFTLFLQVAQAGVPNPTIASALAGFVPLLLGGAAVGWAAGRLAVMLMSAIGRHALAVVSVSVALPYLAYIGAEHIAGASGVIAVVAAAMTLQLTAPGRLPPASWRYLREIWALLAHWAGALIFILAALLVPRTLETLRLGDFVLIAVTVAAAFLARALILYGLLPLLSALRLSPVVERPYRVAILWGGLRGAVTLALALAVTESALVAPETKRLVAVLATGFTLFTLLVQGTTLRWMIGWLQLDRLSPLDNALHDQVIAVALQDVREDVARATERYGLTHDIVRAEAKRFGERLDQTVRAAEEAGEILDRDRITLGLIALTSAERDAIITGIQEQTVPAALAEPMLSRADALIEGAHAGGRAGYNRAARAHLAVGRWSRLATFLHNRLRISGPLARMTADRFGMILVERLILRDLHGFIDRRIRRIHGRRVGDLLHELLNRRIELVEQALDGLRLQYPGYAEEIERRFIRRTALRLEEREYRLLSDDGLVGDEVFSALLRDIARRRQQAEAMPPLDLAVQKTELVRHFPLFQDLDDSDLRQLARSFVTQYANPGELVMRKDATERQVYFIASGAVEQTIAGQSFRLGRGEMFGQLHLLMNKPRRSEVRAITPSTLLVLDEVRFRALLRRSPAIRAAVTERAELRGISPDELGLVDPAASSRPRQGLTR